MTATRLTANPCATVKFPNPETITCDGRGCDVPAMDCDHARRATPAGRASRPCQKPRPGHAWSSAMPRKNAPVPPSSSRPRRAGPSQARSGSASSAPATHVDERRARRAEQHGEPGREDPAERLAEDPDDQPPGHAGQSGEPGGPAAHRDAAATARCRPGSTPPPRPPGRGGSPRRSRRSSPGAAPSRASSAAVGWITWSARPPGICGCAWSSPSNSQMTPKPTRSSSRARGSRHGRRPAAAELPAPEPGNAARACPRRGAAAAKMSSDDQPLMQQRGLERGHEDGAARPGVRGHARHAVTLSTRWSRAQARGQT